MTEFSNMLFNKVVEYFMQDTGTQKQERCRLAMTEEEWAIAMASIEEQYCQDELTEFRNDTIEVMQGDLSGNTLSTEEAETVKQCIDELEQMPFETIKGLIAQLTRWQLETEGLSYVSENQDCQPAGTTQKARLLDFGDLRITEDALKLILLAEG